MLDKKFKCSQSYKAFYESVSERYPEEHRVYESLRGRVRKRFVLSHLKSFRGRFLDLGCNRGTYISHYGAGMAIGVDIAMPVLRLARARAVGANFVQGDAQKLSFLRSGVIDAILCSEMIEHVPDAGKVLSECYRVLKPGGKLLVTTPNYKRTRPEWISIGEMAAYGVQGMRGELYYHTAFRPEELQALARSAGFEHLEVGTFEKEVKYATRIPVLLYHVVDKLNRATLKSSTLDRRNRHMLERASLLVYQATRAIRLDGVLVRLCKEGVRTFLLACK